LFSIPWQNPGLQLLIGEKPMRILIAAALGALSVVSIPFMDVVDDGASAQVLSTQPGNAPADALVRVLHPRNQAKKTGRVASE
jgi:hypothetical protein